MADSHTSDDQEMEFEENTLMESDSTLIKKPDAEKPDSMKITAQKRTDEEYSMKKNPRGKAIIFNHNKYDEKLGLDERKGTEKDQEKIEKVLTNLGFKTEVHNDETFSEIQEILETISTDEEADYDCLIVVVMSHGGMLEVQSKNEKFGKFVQIFEKNHGKDELRKLIKEAGLSQKEMLEIKGKEEKVGKLTRICAKDQEYDEEELWKPFLEGERNKKLLGKPKLFFIQACRSLERKKDGNLGSWVPAKAHQEGSAPTETLLNAPTDYYSIPDAADLLIARCTFEEWEGYRDPDNGSPFIQTLCQELEADLKRKDDEKYDLLRILTNVNRKVALNYPIFTADEALIEVIEAKKDSPDQYKQMPSFYSTLTRMLYFKNLTECES